MLKFANIVRMSQAKLKATLNDELVSLKYKPLNKRGFLYAKGTIPVLLIAHLDTVHKSPVTDICYSSNGSVIMSPQGIGGDDRCGVFMILEIIRQHKCHVLFCEDEECGAIGARCFTASGIKPKVNFLVEIDRRGSNDAVFYDCDNPEFTKFVETFGFSKEWGSSSDISVIAPHLEIAAVNISAGYHNEHTLHEHVNLNEVKNNIERIGRMVSAESKKFEYIERAHYYQFSRTFRDKYDFGYYSDYRDIGTHHNVRPFSSKKDEEDEKPEEMIDDEFLADEVINKDLMQLYDPNYVLDTERRMIECEGDYLIDEKGIVYLYDGIIDMCVEQDGFKAYGEHGFETRFDEFKAEPYDTISEDGAVEYKFRLCYCQ